MIQSESLAALSLVWVGCAAASLALRMGGRKASSGVLLAWLLNLFAINGFPGVVFAIAGDWNPDLTQLEDGMGPAALSMMATLAGVALAEALRVRRREAGSSGVPLSRKAIRVQDLIRLASLGLIALVALRVLPQVGTLTAVLSGGIVLLPVGLGLLLSWAGDNLIRVSALLATAMLPLVTSVGGGFLGYGLAMLVIAGSLAVGRSHTRIRAALMLAAAGYIALSFFVSYTEKRGPLRQAVWAGAGVGERMDAFLEIVAATTPFSVTTERDRIAVDMRLNQISFVGLARNNLAVGTVDFARGETIRDALFALVPRALWLEKPLGAGSGDIVTRFTGLTFAEGTSVGATQLMESYANFGGWGVVLFFGVAGFLMALADHIGGEAIAKGDMPTFLVVTLPACAATSVGGSFVELSVSAVAGIGVGWIAGRSAWFSNRTGPAAQPGPPLSERAG